MTLFDLLHENALADNDVLRLSDKQGDIFGRPRNVDFLFKTPDRERAEDLAEYINGKNFGTAKTSVTDEGNYWVLVIIHMPTTQHVVCCISAFMLCLSRLFQVEYDGWGSVSQGSTDG